MLWGLAGLACRPGVAVTAVPEGSPATPEPSASAGDDVDAAIARLADPASRAQGIAGFDHLVREAKTDRQREALAKAMVPAFLAIWDEASPHRLAMLRTSLSFSHPAAAPLWTRAIGLDGSAASRDATLLALDGVSRTHATACTPAIIDALEHILAHPEFDGGQQEGDVRVALVGALEELGGPTVVPVLRSVLEQPIDRQPIAVYRAAVSALGRLRAAETVDALLMTPFRVPDAMTSTNLAERVKAALAAIGEPAVAPTVRMLEGKHAGIQELAALNYLPQDVVEMTAASDLGAIGSATSVAPLLVLLPRAGCRGNRRRAKPDADAEFEMSLLSRRAVVANALGLIGDPRAVRPLCDCATASESPSDMFVIAEALGRIGGAEATACLARVARTAVYDEAAVADRSFVHELRWEAVRFLILAAGMDDVAVIDALLRAPKSASKSALEVVRNRAQWRPGLEVLTRCRDALPCFLDVLGDTDAPGFAREVAATHAARLAPGDEAVALAIAKAYAVTDPDARVTMAWLVGHTMNGRRCPACADALRQTLDHDRGTPLPAAYQLSVLMARYAIARTQD